MKKTIAMVVHNRPQYLKQVLESMAKNDWRDWTLLVGIDPSEKLDEVVDVIEGIDFIPHTWMIQPYKLGEHLNNFVTISKAVKDGAEFLIYQEEDMVISPDVANLAEWYIGRTDLHDPRRYAGLCLHRKDISEPERPAAITLKESDDRLFGYGFVFSAEQWKEFYRRHWFYYERWFGGDGWDWAIGHMVEKLGLIVARPCLSRATHIGAEGMNCITGADCHIIAEDVWQRFFIED